MSSAERHEEGGWGVAIWEKEGAVGWGIWGGGEARHVRG